MRKVLRYLDIFLGYFAQFTKARLSYRADFLVGMAADLLSQLTSLAFLLIVFTQIPQLRGWSLDELVFIYGFFLIPYGLFNVFFSGLWSIGGYYIVDGHLDRVLLRPASGLLQILMESVDPESLNGVITGSAMVIYAAQKLHLVLSAPRLLLLGLLILGAVFVYAGLFLALSCASFWFEDRVGLLPPFYNLIDFGKYPTSIYSRSIRAVITWLIPYAFVAFYPSAMLLRGGEFTLYGLLTPVVGAAFTALGYLLWRRGLRRYQSTGT